MTDMSVGNCVASPICTKVIPIYPVRYAVMPADAAGYRYGKGSNLDTQFPDLPETNYCLRNLRDETYVYIYDPASREKWFCYQYNRKGMPGFQTMRIDDKDASLSKSFSPPSAGIEYSVHFHKATKIYMINIDSPLTKDTMKKVEGGELRSKIMQEIDVGTWFGAYESHWQAKKEILRDPPKVKHIINSINHISWNVDFDKKFKSAWSENTADTKSPQDAISSVVKKAGVMEGAFVALYDAVGIASELSHLVNFEVDKIKKDSEFTARKQWVSETIDNLTKVAADRAYSEGGADAVSHSLTSAASYNGATGGAVLRAQEKIRKAKEYAKAGAIKDYNKTNRIHERKKFIAELPNKRQEILNQIQLAGKPHVTFIKYKGNGSFINTMLAYDTKDDNGYLAYQGALARSVDGLIVTTEGSQYIAGMLPSSGPTELFKQALEGHPSINTYVEMAANIKGAADAVVEAKVKALEALPIQPSQASKYLALITTTALIQNNTFGEFKEFIQSKYSVLFEVAEGNPVNKGTFKTSELPQLLYKATTSSTSLHNFKPTSQLTETTELYYLGQTKNPFVQVDLTPQQLKTYHKLNYWHNATVSLSGLGTAIAAYNVVKTLSEYKDEDKSALVTSLSLATNLMGGAAATYQLKQTVFTRRAALTTNATIHSTADKTAFMAGRAALGFAAAASLTAAVNSTIKAFKSETTSSKALYFTSATAHGTVATVGFYHLMASSKNPAIKSAGKALGGVILRRAGVLLGPKAALALLAIELIAFSLEKWAEAQDKSKEHKWIEQSIWGTETNKTWTYKKERYEILRLFIKPKVTYDATRTSGYENVTVILPGYQPQVSHVEVRKSGKLIKKDAWDNDIKPTIKDEQGSRILEYKRIDYLGVVSVEYWPNRFADPETSYKADTNWYFDPPMAQD